MVTNVFGMDQSWMFIPNRLNKDYIAGVNSFIDATKKHLDTDNQARCLGRDCQNESFHRQKLFGII